MFNKISFLTATLILILVALIGGVTIYFVYSASINEITKINQIYAKTTETALREIYFCHTESTKSRSCKCDSPVMRRIANAYSLKTQATTTIKQLLEGPTTKEKEDGYTTSIPTKEQIAAYKLATNKKMGDEVKLLALDIKDGVATLNFSKEISAFSGGSCWREAISSATINTLSQFGSIKQVNILIEGNELTLQP
jgi:spore germination protein GerM